MKMKMVLMCFVLFGFAAFVGCGKEDTTVDEVDENYSLQVKVGGSLLTIDQGILTAIIVNNTGSAGSYLEIAGWAGYGNSQILVRLRQVSSGTLTKSTLQTGNVTNFMLEVADSGNRWKNQKYDLTDVHVSNPNGVPDGQFTISEISDTNILGTFSFTGYNEDDGSKKNVTQGEFNATFVGMSNE